MIIPHKFCIFYQKKLLIIHYQMITRPTKFHLFLCYFSKIKKRAYFYTNVNIFFLDKKIITYNFVDSLQLYEMELTEKDIKRVQDTIHSVSAYDFSDYSYNSFCRRIEKILNDYSITLDTLIANIQDNYNYLEMVVRDITVNTTELFRDTEIWANIREMLITRYADKPALNIWHAGCSSGQEVYSMLIMLNELGMLEKATVYATDINEKMLNSAMSGQYKFHEVQDYIGNFDKVFNPNPQSQLTPYVDISKYIDVNKYKDYVKMSQCLVEKPLFLKHDLVSCEPIVNNEFDIIMCRNVLIYFNHYLQNKVLKSFYSCLSSDGSLIIGRHEGMIGHVASLFSKKGCIYSKNRTR